MGKDTRCRSHFKITCLTIFNVIAKLFSASDFYPSFISTVPHDYSMLCKRAELYVTLGKYEEARCDGDKACAMKPLKAKVIHCVLK